MDRRTFILAGAAAALHASRAPAWSAAAVELGSIDGSVSGNNFTAVTCLHCSSESDSSGTRRMPVRSA